MISPPLLLLTIGLGMVADPAHPPASQAPPEVRVAGQAGTPMEGSTCDKSF
jgi:hypothetical protein